MGWAEWGRGRSLKRSLCLFESLLHLKRRSFSHVKRRCRSEMQGSASSKKGKGKKTAIRPLSFLSFFFFFAFSKRSVESLLLICGRGDHQLTKPALQLWPYLGRYQLLGGYMSWVEPGCINKGLTLSLAPRASAVL